LGSGAEDQMAPPDPGLKKFERLKHVTKEFEDIAKEHFVKAIKNALPKPTPLIGSKWFRFHPNGEPADLEFTGIRKLAKASGVAIGRVAKQVVGNLSAETLNCQIELTEDHIILVRKNKKKAEGGETSQAPAEPGEPAQDDGE